MFNELARALGLAIVFAVGCAKSPVAKPPASGSATTTEEAAAPTPPEGAKVLCHLDCSGNEAQAYGATEEEARANVRKFVAEKCKPEDGQFFIFCDPAK